MDNEQTLNRVLDDILRQVVCDCGNYRHHGVRWMPEGSGEGRSVGRMILLEWLRAGNSYNGQYICRHRTRWLDCVECCGGNVCPPSTEDITVYVEKAFEDYEREVLFEKKINPKRS